MRVPRIDEVIRPVANPASRPDRKQYGSPWKLCKISGQISARLNPLLLLSGIDQSCRSGQFLFTDRQPRSIQPRGEQDRSNFGQAVLAQWDGRLTGHQLARLAIIWLLDWLWLHGWMVSSCGNVVWGTAVLWIMRLRDIFFVVYADNCCLDFGDKIDEKRYLDNKRIEEN